MVQRQSRHRAVIATAKTSLRPAARIRRHHPHPTPTCTCQAQHCQRPDRQATPATLALQAQQAQQPQQAQQQGRGESEAQLQCPSSSHRSHDPPRSKCAAIHRRTDLCTASKAWKHCASKPFPACGCSCMCRWRSAGLVATSLATWRAQPASCLSWHSSAACGNHVQPSLTWPARAEQQ